jgi:hypothetical protein
MGRWRMARSTQGAKGQGLTSAVGDGAPPTAVVESLANHCHPNQQLYIPPWAYGGDELVEPLQLPSGSHPGAP